MTRYTTLLATDLGKFVIYQISVLCKKQKEEKEINFIFIATFKHTSNYLH